MKKNRIEEEPLIMFTACITRGKLDNLSHSPSLAYSILARLHKFAEKRVWPQSRGLVVTHCHHSIFVGVPAKRQQPVSVISTFYTNIVLSDLIVQSDSQYIQSLKY